jgi:hypothetical protein
MSEWISVKDRLPDHTKRVLVVYKNAHHHTPKGEAAMKRNRRTVVFAIFGGGQWRFIDKRDKTRLHERVTHWQEVPPLPDRGRRPVARESNREYVCGDAERSSHF